MCKYLWKWFLLFCAHCTLSVKKKVFGFTKKKISKLLGKKTLKKVILLTILVWMWYVNMITPLRYRQSDFDKIFKELDQCIRNSIALSMFGQKLRVPLLDLCGQKWQFCMTDIFILCNSSCSFYPIVLKIGIAMILRVKNRVLIFHTFHFSSICPFFGEIVFMTTNININPFIIYFNA